MRSDLRFVMHPSDEEEFAKIVNAEPGTVFVDGPSWSTPRPPISKDLRHAGHYLIIWNPSETPPLTGKHYKNNGEEWWYCKNEFLTIQFLRSGFKYKEPYLFEGRIAVATTDKSKRFFHELSASRVESRYKALRKAIKKVYKNNVIIWQSLSSPRSWNNPLKPDRTIWVGPHAMQWLRQNERQRWVQQCRGAGARGYLLDLVKPD
jgi:hypothetical protein